MLTKLKQMYKDKFIENVEQIDNNNYYYFYKSNSSSDLFAVRKDISNNEYQLISSMYLEKKFYSQDKVKEEIYEYILNNKKTPFTKKMRIVIFLNYSKELDSLLDEIYLKKYNIELYNLNIVFIENYSDIKLKELYNTIVYDLGIQTRVHEGIVFDPSAKGEIIKNYIIAVRDYFFKFYDHYFDYIEPLLKLQDVSKINYAKIIKEVVITPLFSDPILKDIVLTYFKDDLNVSQTAKDLYMNRNSILNKFDMIYKLTGLNLQKFSHACAVYLLMNNQNE